MYQLHSQHKPPTAAETSQAAPRIDPSGRLIQAQAPASGVSVPRHMGVGSDLVHTLDYVVLLQIMFNLASGIVSTPALVLQQLQERGIRSAKNARELVGKTAVYESFARLLEAGYLRRTQPPHPTKPGRKGPVVYEVFDNPAWNPNWKTPESHGTVNPQVTQLPGTPEPVFPEADKPAGQTASRNARSGNTGSGVPGSRKRRVPAGRNTSGVPGSGIASPPLPPGGGGTTPPPNPLSTSRTAVPQQAQPEEKPAVVFSDAEVAAAATLLCQLPDPWEIGEQDARELAPTLLASMAAKGWPTIHDVDPAQLVPCLTSNPGRMNNPYLILERRRIPNLTAYQRAAARSAKRAPAEGMCRQHAAFREGDCSPCRLAERKRARQVAADPGQQTDVPGGAQAVDGAGLLARLRAGLPSGTTS